MDTLIDTTTAGRLIADALAPFGTETVALAAAAGRILRQDVHAETAQPPFDRVMMDGIAIAWQAALPEVFALAGVRMAGAVTDAHAGGLPLRDGGCIEVTTGAVLPEGCDCVIPVEQTRRDAGGYALVPGHVPAQWQFVHRAGSDCAGGSVVLRGGVRIGGPEMSLLAGNGVARVVVARSPAIAVVVTGDELAGPDAVLLPGQIRRSNDLALLGALHQAGFARVSLHHVVDDEHALGEMLAGVLRDHEVLVVSGGVSMGQRDYVPGCLDRLGVRRVFHGIAQRPGKPMWFGIGPQHQAVFALPGNPVSSLVCMTRYVRPALEAASGLAVAAAYVQAGDDAGPGARLTRFLPARVSSDPDGVARARAGVWSNSGDFTALAGTHGIVELPAGQAVAAGDALRFHRW